MLSQFFYLFVSLHKWCKENSDKDLTQVEDAMVKLLDAWTDVMMNCVDEPTDAELDEYMQTMEYVENLKRWMD